MRIWAGAVAIGRKLGAEIQIKVGEEILIGIGVEIQKDRGLEKLELKCR